MMELMRAIRRDVTAIRRSAGRWANGTVTGTSPLRVNISDGAGDPIPAKAGAHSPTVGDNVILILRPDGGDSVIVHVY